jgi:3-phenylpropionate/cinnamic acid dioxygenase small subunit
VSAAHEEIRNLLGTYCEVMDAGDWEALGALFAHGAITDDRGRAIARGSDEIAGLWTAMVRLYDGSPLTRHLVSGPIISVDGETATCRSGFLVAQKPPGKDMRLVASGRYRDTFAVVDGTWCFTERMFFLEQEGDMSQHMVDL